jgi:hypothetical protein
VATREVSTPPPDESPRSDLHITSDEFDDVGAEIAGALDHFGVPEREK